MPWNGKVEYKCLKICCAVILLLERVSILLVALVLTVYKIKTILYCFIWIASSISPNFASLLSYEVKSFGQEHLF